jgi:subtilisin family serine protease
VSLVAVPSKLIPAINALPGVRAVHADLEVRALVYRFRPPDRPMGPRPPRPRIGAAPPRPQVLTRGLEVLDQDLWYSTSESRNVLEAELAFRAGFTGESIRLGVIDTGIDPAHQQMQGAEWDSVINLPVREILDDNGHGSHVASTAAGRLASSPTGIFAEGVSRAQIHSIKALGRLVGTGFTSEIINAMALALEKGDLVVNMSLGSQECQGTCENCPQCRAVRLLSERGLLVAVAAGNSGPDANTINCPGCSPDAITVGAVDRNGRAAGFSSRGGTRFPTKPDVAAPGVDIFSGTGQLSITDGGDPQAGFGYAAISGTSMAAPHVAGLLALLKQRDPGLTRERFMDRVRRRGGEFNHNTGYGVPKWSWF